MNFCVSSETMKESDRLTIENVVSGEILMRRAAVAVFESYDFSNKKIYILCGKGNNGGDGYALAEVLLEHDIVPVIYQLGEPKTNSALFYYNKLRSRGYNEFYNYTKIDYSCDVLVDCVFGVGFSRQLSDEISRFFKEINSNFKGDVISVDIPSGLNSDNGLGKDSIKATYTIAIQSFKLGHFLADAKDKCGILKVKDIGIKIIGDKYDVIDDKFVKIAFPDKLNNTNKGSYGKSVLIGGCSNYIGASKLAAIACASLRMGCGLSTLAIPSSLMHAVTDSVIDNTVYELADKDGYIVFDKPSIDKLINGVDAIGIGMGIGNHYEENLKIIEYIVKNYKGKLLIDADGLNSLKDNVDILDHATCDIILTPHPKEMSRLTGLSVEEILDNPLGITKEFVKNHNVTVLLKGTSTLVVNKNRVSVVSNGGPGLAKAGSGDVLSGTITGLMSRGIDVFLAGSIGAYICAYANKKACEKYGDYAVLSSDTAIEIGNSVKEILNI